MNIINYIKGNRKGAQANKLEKEALRDPFLYEALEGYDAIDGDHLVHLSTLQKKIGQSSSHAKRNNLSLIWKIAIAASVVGLVFFSKKMFTDSFENEIQANASSVELLMDIYVPQDFYQENIAVIACLNTELSRNLSVVTYRSSTDLKKHLSDEDIQMIDNTISPLEIYFPMQ